MDGLFETKNGRIIQDLGLSEKMYKLCSLNIEHEFEWSEMGMASAFGILWEQECRYCPEFKSWYVYRDGIWRRDEGGILVSECIKDFVRLLMLYLLEMEGDDDLIKKYSAFVARLGDRRMRDRIQKDATGELYLPATDFDSKPYLIACLNGVYDLRDFTFRESRWDDFITMQTRFNHTIDRAVKCDRWEQFISEVCCGDEDKMDYLQRALGYSLFGSGREECMFILWGKTTRNGKSTLLNTIEYLLGDYAKVAPVGLICRTERGGRDYESASPTLVGLKGKRFVTMAESNEYGKLDEEKIKQLTGGEEISARALHQAPITFTPQFKLWLSCNDLPSVSDMSLFASDRLRVIEFTRHFSASEQDKSLKEIFMDSSAMPGIFMWLVRGYKKYLSSGLDMADSMATVVQQYRAANDLVGMFVDLKCERVTDENEGDVKYNSLTSTKELYAAFKSWSRSEGLNLISNRKFIAELERAGFQKTRGTGNVVCIVDLRLKTI
jgi:putative DNA primase/helicase